MPASAASEIGADKSRARRTLRSTRSTLDVGVPQIAAMTAYLPLSGLAVVDYRIQQRGHGDDCPAPLRCAVTAPQRPAQRPRRESPRLPRVVPHHEHVEFERRGLAS